MSGSGQVNIVNDLTEHRQAEEQLHQQAHILKTLNQVNMSLAAELNLEKLLQAVTDAATELSGAQFGAFFYNAENEQGELYTLYTLSGAPRAAFEQFPMPRNTPVFGPTFRGERIIRLDDVTQDPNYGQNPPYQGMPKGHLPVRSYLAAPVVSRTGQVIGGLFLGHPEPGVFTEQAEQLVSGVATQAAIALDNARIYEAERAARAEAERAQQRLALLAKAGEALIDSPDYKTIVANLTEVIIPSLADWCVVDVVGEDGLIHRLAVVHHDPAKAELTTRLQHDYPALNPQGEHTIARMMRQGHSWFDAKVTETRFVAEARDSEHLDILRGLGFASEMVVPLMARGRTLGALTFVRGSLERHYEPADLSLAEELARRAALAIDNARLYNELRDSEERFRVTIQNSPIVVYNTDRELHYTWIAKPYPGSPLEALIEPQAQKKPGWEEANPIITLEKRVLESGAGAREEISLPTTSGGQTWDVTVEPLRAEDGQVTGLTVVALDITERKRAEERMVRLQEVAAALSAALTPSQVYEVIVQKAASALDAKAGTLYIMSNDGQWLELAQMTGYGEGSPETEIRIPLAAPFPVAQTARTGEAVWLKAAVSLPLWFEWRVLGSLNFNFASDRTLDEEECEFLLTLARLCAQALERARLYQEAQQLNVELEKRVAERTAELERSLKELDDFTYVASHDLRGPLRNIRLLATWIVEDANEVLPAASREHLAKLQSRIQRLEKMLEDLLAYYRLDHHHYQNLGVVNTRNLIESVIDLLAPPPGFVVTVQKNIPKLTTHRILLELVFRNLIGNAIKHHHRSEGHIDISAREGDHFIEFSVTDDGPGIDPTFHKRIFQIFQVLRPRDQVEGSGIGLAIVKRTVESQGGAIKVISAEGQGTTFSFTWPKS